VSENFFQLFQIFLLLSPLCIPPIYQLPLLYPEIVVFFADGDFKISLFFPTSNGLVRGGALFSVLCTSVLVTQRDNPLPTWLMLL
jgi:hypothetical protein